MNIYKVLEGNISSKGKPSKKEGLFGNFSQTSEGQVGNFWVILRCFKRVFRAMVKITKVLGIGKTPPPMLGKIPK